jgi:hypothetical protein
VCPGTDGETRITFVWRADIDHGLAEIAADALGPDLDQARYMSQAADAGKMRAGEGCLTVGL